MLKIGIPTWVCNFVRNDGIGLGMMLFRVISCFVRPCYVDTLFHFVYLCMDIDKYYIVNGIFADDIGFSLNCYTWKGFWNRFAGTMTKMLSGIYDVNPIQHLCCSQKHVNIDLATERCLKT